MGYKTKVSDWSHHETIWYQTERQCKVNAGNLDRFAKSTQSQSAFPLKLYTSFFVNEKLKNIRVNMIIKLSSGWN